MSLDLRRTSQKRSESGKKYLKLVLDLGKSAKLEYRSGNFSKTELISQGKRENRVGLGLDSVLGCVKWAKIWSGLRLQSATWGKIRFGWDQGLGL